MKHVLFLQRCHQLCLLNDQKADVRLGLRFGGCGPCPVPLNIEARVLELNHNGTEGNLKRVTLGHPCDLAQLVEVLSPGLGDSPPNMFEKVLKRSQEGFPS